MRSPRRISAVGKTSPEVLVSRQIYWWALAVRLLAGLGAYFVDQLTTVPVLEDAAFYEEIGYAVARSWLSGRSVDFETLPQGAQTAWLLVLVIAGFHYLTDGVRAVPVLLVAYSAVTAVVPTYVLRIALELGAPEAVARRAAWLVALSPAFVFWSGSLYKEGLTLLVLSLAAYHTLKLQSRWQAGSVAILALCALTLWGLRYYLAILLGVSMALALLWGRRVGTASGEPMARTMSAPRLIIAGVFLGLMLMLGLTERTERFLLETDKGVLVDLDNRRSWSAQAAESGYLREERIATQEDALRYVPLGVFYFLVVPLPWQTGSVRQNLVIPENALWLLLYPLILVGIMRAIRINPSGTVFLLMMTAGMCMIYALLVANVGTAYRMRTQIWVLWAPFAMWGWEIWRSRPDMERARPRLRRTLVRGTPGAARMLRRVVNRSK
jgi:hypothetical protein